MKNIEIRELRKRDHKKAIQFAIKGMHFDWYTGNRLLLKLLDLFAGIFAKDGVDVYDKANQEMYRQYCETNRPQGEIVFLAADPDRRIPGVGTALLQELGRRAAGKQICLYTDNACTYQFYEHRGFERVGEREILMELGDREVKLQCFLYSILFPGNMKNGFFRGEEKINEQV